MASKNSNSAEKKNSTEEIDIVDLTYQTVAPAIEEDGADELAVQVDITGVSFERQAVEIPVATALLNEQYDCNLWAHPHHIIGDVEKFAEDCNTPVEKVKADFLSPEELQDMFGEIVQGVEMQKTQVENDVTEETVEKVENITSILDREDFESHGVDDIEEHIEAVLDGLERGAKPVFNNQVNVSYLLYEDMMDTDMSKDEKILFAKISAYCLGHSGCRIGVWKGDVVAVDDVRMYANRHEFEPSEFIEQSWSQKEAEVTLSSE